MSNTLPTSYQSYIHVSKYARYRDDLGRRETWEETVTRFIDYFKKRISTGNKRIPWDELREAILNLEVMPSMRCMMTAGEALDIDQCAGYNCSYITIDQPKAFDEIMYILMCLAPETLVKTRVGPVAISQLNPGDEVLSYDDISQSYVWRPVVRVIETPSADKPKLAITLENGQVIQCTEDHKWLTTNRGWVEARDLTKEDDLVAPEGRLHWHHIIPKHDGGTDNPTNLELVTLEQHAERHYHRWQKLGQLEDKLAWLMLSGKTVEAEEVRIQLSKEGLRRFKESPGYASWLRHTSESAKARDWSDEDIQRQRKVINQAREKINQTRQTSEYRERQRLANTGPRNPQYGKRHITDGSRNRMIHPDREVLPDGWWYGRTQPKMPRDDQGRFKP